jgi:hypothetical protein
MRCEVSAVEKIKIVFLWALAHCSVVSGYQHVGGTCWLHLRYWSESSCSRFFRNDEKRTRDPSQSTTIWMFNINVVWIPTTCKPSTVLLDYIFNERENIISSHYLCNRPWRPIGLCETSRLPHFLDNRLTDGGKVVSLTLQPPFTPDEVSWYSFLLEAESTSGP